MSVSVRFELTRDDAKALHERAVEVAARGDDRKWARRHRWSLTVSASAFTVGLLWLYVRWVRGDADPGWLVMMGVLVPLVIHWWGRVRSAFRKDRRERIEEPWLDHVWERHRCTVHDVTVAESGLREVTPGADVSVGWEMVFHLDETEEHIFVDRRGVETLIVPKRALGSAAEARLFVEEIGRRMRSAGADPESRVRAYLAGRDRPCFTCGYNLRGVGALACPECGQELSAEVMEMVDLTKEKERVMGKRVVVRRRPT
jgi:YcxB-like protein